MSDGRGAGAVGTNRVLVAVGAAAALAVSGGCFSNSTMTLARTQPKGTVTGYVGPTGVVVTSTGNCGGSTSCSGSIGWAQVEGGFHYSVTDEVEIGLKGYIPGLAFDTKIGFIRARDPDNGFNLSIDPEIGIMGFAVGSSSSSGGGSVGAAALTFSLPLLLGIDFSGHELVIAPRLTDWLFIAGADSANAGGNILFAGGSVGMAFKVLPKLRIMPDISVMAPVLLTGFANGMSATVSTSNFFAGLVVQFGVGFLFGGEDRRVAPPMYNNSPPPMYNNSPPPGYVQ